MFAQRCWFYQQNSPASLGPLLCDDEACFDGFAEPHFVGEDAENYRLSARTGRGRSAKNQSTATGEHVWRWGAGSSRQYLHIPQAHEGDQCL